MQATQVLIPGMQNVGGMHAISIAMTVAKRSGASCKLSADLRVAESVYTFMCAIVSTSLWEDLFFSCTGLGMENTWPGVMCKLALR